MESKDRKVDSSKDIVILLQVPREVLSTISSLLPTRDIKSLRQTCKALSKLVPLHFRRVFLSANPINIQVFRAIADHDVFRHDVRELIYDDAHLFTGWLPQSKDDETPKQMPHSEIVGSHERVGSRRRRIPPEALRLNRIDARSREEKFACAERGAQHMFRGRSNQNNEDLVERRGDDLAELPQHVRRQKMFEAQAGWEESFSIYTLMAKQQIEVVTANSDADALIYGFERFPNLERITVTPATHGFLYTPLYETPMIRALPPGFNYPMPRAWPHARPVRVGEPDPWVSSDPRGASRIEPYNARWRGLRLVLKYTAELVRSGKCIPELVIDVHGLYLGLNPHMFAQFSAEYSDLSAIVRQPGFRRLDLPILFDKMSFVNWEPLCNGFFRELLSTAKHMQHFRLVSEGGYGFNDRWVTRFENWNCPLLRMLPVKDWKELQHFGLYRIPVKISDVIALLAALPSTVRSVELSFLIFDHEEGYWDLLNAIKMSLKWHTREPSKRPKVIIGLPQCRDYELGRGLWLGSEIADFLYGSGPNPVNPKGLGPGTDYGIGIVKDEFDPEYERPNLAYEDMVKLGIYKPKEGPMTEEEAAKEKETE